MRKDNIRDPYPAMMTIIICILILLCILFMITGCNSLPFLQSKPIPKIPTPSDQLWKAVKDSNWLITFSILGIAAGFFAFFNGSKMGLPAIGASCVSLFMALAVARFATWMAVCGLIASIASVAISIIIKNKALKDFVCNIQHLKDGCKKNGNSISVEAINAELKDQEKSTKKVVQQIKSGLKLKGEM